MRVAWLLSVAGLAISLSAADVKAQALVQGNDTGGIIPWSCENEAAAWQVAGAFCAGYAKYPRITSVYRQYGGYIGFHCLWDPKIGRYQIPVVPVRSACVAEAQRLHPRVRVLY
jgi:hypothetical protein